MTVMHQEERRTGRCPCLVSVDGIERKFVEALDDGLDDVTFGLLETLETLFAEKRGDR